MPVMQSSPYKRYLQYQSGASTSNNRLWFGTLEDGIIEYDQNESNVKREQSIGRRISTFVDILLRAKPNEAVNYCENIRRSCDAIFSLHRAVLSAGHGNARSHPRCSH